jgi:hypothetical protein
LKEKREKSVEIKSEWSGEEELEETLLKILKN